MPSQSNVSEANPETKANDNGVRIVPIRVHLSVNDLHRLADIGAFSDAAFAADAVMMLTVLPPAVIDKDIFDLSHCYKV
jgi:hypothetical protein